MGKETNSSSVRLDISWRTILKVLLAVLLVFVAIKLWPLFKLLIVSVLLAVPLYRLVLWLCDKGWPRWSGLLVASLGLVVLVAGLAALVGPLVFSQASKLGKNLPNLKQQIVAHVPPGALRNAVQQAANYGSTAAIQGMSQNAIAAVKVTLGGILDVVLIIALTIYMMIDGARALRWLVAFFPREHRQRVSRGLDKIGGRIVAYIVGQSIVSGLFAGYVLLVLSILRVPMALLLAVIAGFLDVVPVLGISISLLLGRSSL